MNTSPRCARSGSDRIYRKDSEGTQYLYMGLSVLKEESLLHKGSEFELLIDRNTREYNSLSPTSTTRLFTFGFPSVFGKQGRVRVLTMTITTKRHFVTLS